MNGLDGVFWLWQKVMLDAFHLKKFKNIKPGFVSHSLIHITSDPFWFTWPIPVNHQFEWYKPEAIIKPLKAIDISKRYNDFDPEIEAQKVFEDSVTTFPVHDEQMMFKLHKKYSEVEIDVTYRNIYQLFSRKCFRQKKNIENWIFWIYLFKCKTEKLNRYRKK